MTAEIAILNKSAIALAADSAASVGGDTGKIYNTVNKLFTLSKHRPVGVMVYGNADYMGIPFETIIKTYREGLGRRAEARIEDYASKFTKHLGSSIFASSHQQGLNVRHTWETVFADMADDIRRAVEREFRAKGDCTTKRQKQIVGEVSATHLLILYLPPTPPGPRKRIRVKFVFSIFEGIRAREKRTCGRGAEQIDRCCVEEDRWICGHQAASLSLGFGNCDRWIW